MNAVLTKATALNYARTRLEVICARVYLVICWEPITNHAMVSLVSTFIRDYSSIQYSLDIDECRTNIGNCSQLCTNTDGSYFCSCQSGYLLEANNQSCNGKSGLKRISLIFTIDGFSLFINELCLLCGMLLE